MILSRPLRPHATAALLLGLMLSSEAAPSGTKGIQRAPAGGASTSASPPLAVRAVVVGIDDYRHLPAEQDLSTSEGDARLIVEALKQTVDPADLVTLLGKEASAEALERQVRGVLQRATEREAVVIYMGTHGARVGQRGYLLAQDSQPEGRLPATALSIEALEREIESSKAQSVLLFLDTVHAELKGAAGVRSGPEGSVSALLGALASAREGVFALLSEDLGASDAECPGHGAFACALSQALLGRADLNGDASVTFGEMARALPSALRERAAPEAEIAAYGSYDAELAFLAPPASAPLTSATAARVSPARWTRPPDSLDVCLFANGAPVSADHVFRDGDRLHLSLTLPRTGHLYVMNIGPDGQENMLFPLEGEENRVSEGATVQLLPADSPTPMVLTPPAGEERLFIVWSAEAMSGTRAALAFARAEAGRGESQVAWSDMTRTKGITRLAPATTPAATPTRCQSYTPQGGAEAWTLALALQHR